MELLIATSAVVDEAPLVTRDVKDFKRVPGLELLLY
jgi:predicted nucleic acid-binding protein